ncbi:MAG: tetratricopeptide repeat protein [Nitrososphaera sp.]|nr:tetratricopeptide repeat protein [Nitrososphaera sp.]
MLHGENSFCDDVNELVAAGFRILEGKDRWNAELYESMSSAAKAQFEEALRRDPNCYRAIVGLGVCLSFNPRELTAALELFRRAINMKPEEAEAYYEIGNTMFIAGERGYYINGREYEDALEFLREAAKRNYKQLSWLYNHVGIIHYRMRKYDEAIRYFEESAKQVAEDGTWIPSTFNLAAKACEEIGDIPAAIRWYERLLEHSPLKEAEFRQRIEALRAIANEQSTTDGSGLK